MKTNTVILDLEEYNFLRDFHKGIVEGEIVHVYSHMGYRLAHYVSDNEQIENLKDEIVRLEEQNDKLRNESQKINPTVIEIREMSIWQFIKWRMKSHEV